MISLQLYNAFTPETKVLKKDFRSFSSRLPDLWKKFTSRQQGFYEIIDDASLLNDILAYRDQVRGRYTHIVILGIGGSALGAKALRESLCEKGQSPTLHILDNVDPDFLSSIETQIPLSQTLFLVISKSGGTTETMAQYFHFREKVKKSGLPLKEHFTFITGKDSFLHQIGQKENFPCFFVPENVGGRFSVLTAVGLVPAALIGIDIEALLRGAQTLKKQFVSLDFEENQPFQLAVLQYIFEQKSYTNNVLMPYGNKLKTFSEWYAQLLAESTGKENKDGENVGLALFPALGATDQHSQLQLYSEGPRDKFLIFMKIENFAHDVPIPVPGDMEKFSFLREVSFAHLLHTELAGTCDALREKGVPQITIHVPEVSAEVLGELFFLFQGATAFLGELMQINAFNQPGVERSKVLTKKYLQGD